MITIEDLIADYEQVRSYLVDQIAALDGGSRIRPAGATDAEATIATAAWVTKLRKFAAEYDAIIADLRGQLANA
jgi:hypothetical protein